MTKTYRVMSDDLTIKTGLSFEEAGDFIAARKHPENYRIEKILYHITKNGERLYGPVDVMKIANQLLETAAQMCGDMLYLTRFSKLNGEYIFLEEWYKGPGWYDLYTHELVLRDDLSVTEFAYKGDTYKIEEC